MQATRTLRAILLLQERLLTAILKRSRRRSRLANLPPAITDMGSIPKYTRRHPNNGHTSFTCAHGSWPFSANVSAGSITQNKVVYISSFLPYRITIKNLWWSTGTVISGGNFDIGLYTESGFKIVSTGSTATGAGGAKKIVALAANLDLMPGTYYWGFVCSGSNLNYACISANSLLLRQLGMVQDTATGVPLPATMTVAQDTESKMPFLGADLV